MGGPGSGRKKSGSSKVNKGYKDLTQGLGKTRHSYNPKTGEHIYKGKHYTKSAWNKKFVD